jgi:tyrosyl-tRNA synthetase
MAEIAEMQRDLAAGSANPMELKMRLARAIVAQFHSPAAAAEAEASFDRQFRRRELPEDMPVHRIAGPTNIIDLMVAAGLASSKGEARRLIDGGGVRVAGEKVEGYDVVISPETPVVVQVGRRKFVQVQGQ